MLNVSDVSNVQTECEVAIKKIGNINILVILDNFSGWGKGEGWEDLSFAERNDQFINKFAIVGDEKWKDLAYAFTLKGLRPVPIKYFGAGDEAAAREWLEFDD